MKKAILFLAAAIFSVNLFAQEMLGIANSNYAGISGMHLNPSTIVDSRLKFDLNLISVGVSFDNDYLYIPKKDLKFFGFSNIADQLDAKNYLEYDTTGNKNITFASIIRGPSI